MWLLEPNCKAQIKQNMALVIYISNASKLLGFLNISGYYHMKKSVSETIYFQPYGFKTGKGLHL